MSPKLSLPSYEIARFNEFSAIVFGSVMTAQFFCIGVASEALDTSYPYAVASIILSTIILLLLVIIGIYDYKYSHGVNFWVVTTNQTILKYKYAVAFLHIINIGLTTYIAIKYFENTYRLAVFLCTLYLLSLYGTCTFFLTKEKLAQQRLDAQRIRRKNQRQKARKSLE